MTLSRTPSRCWEDLSADLENLNNLEGSSESESDEMEESTNQRHTNATPNDNKLSDTSTSDNMSYVVDPVKKTFVPINSKKKVNIDGNDDTDSLTSNESDLESSTGMSKQVDSDTDSKTTDDSDGEIFPQKSVDNNKQQASVNHKYQKDYSDPKRNHYSQTYHFPASVSQTSCELYNSLTEVKEYQDPFISTDSNSVPEISIFRPKTPQPSKENEIKRITNLSRCKSIPSNSRLNITPRFKPPSQQKDDSDVINQSSTDDNRPALTKIFPETNIFDTSMTINDSMANAKKPSEELHSNKNNCKTEKNDSYQETVSEKEIFEKSLDRGSPRENLKEFISNSHDEASTTSADLTGRIGGNDKTNEFSSTEQPNTLLSQETAMDRMKVTVSDTDALAELTNTPATIDSITGPPQYQIQQLTVYPSSLLATSGSRKRKHSAIRASTPVPTLDAKPKRGILKKLAERKRLLQVHIPDDSVSADLDDNLTVDKTYHSNDLERDLHNPATFENETEDRSNDKPLTNNERSNKNFNEAAEFIAEGDNNQLIVNDTMNANAENCIIHENVFNENDKAIIVKTEVQDNLETYNRSGCQNKNNNLEEEESNILVKDFFQSEKCPNSKSNGTTLVSNTNGITFSSDIVVARVTPKDEARDSPEEIHSSNFLSETAGVEGTYEFGRERNFEKDGIRETTDKMKDISYCVIVHEFNNIGFESDNNLENSPVTEALKSKILMFDSIKEPKTGGSADQGFEQRGSECITCAEPIGFDHQLSTKKRDGTSDKKPCTKESETVDREVMAFSNMSIPSSQVAEGITDGNPRYIQSDTLEETEITKPDTDSKQIDVNKPFQERHKEPLIKETSEIENDDLDNTGRGYIPEKAVSDSTDFATVIKISNENNQEPFVLNDIESHPVKAPYIQNKEQMITNHISDHPIMKINWQKVQQSGQQIKELKGDRNMEMSVQNLKDKMLIVHIDRALDESNGTSTETRLVKEKKKRSKSFAGQIVKNSSQIPSLYQNPSDHGNGKITEPDTAIDSKNVVNANSETVKVMESKDHQSSTVHRKTGRFSMSKECANRQQIGIMPESTLPMNNPLITNEGENNTVNLSSTRDSLKNSSIGTLLKQFQDGVSVKDSTFTSSSSVVRSTGGVTRRKTIHGSSFETSQSLPSPKMQSLQRGLRETDLRTRPRHFNTSHHDSTNHFAGRYVNFESALPGEKQPFGDVANFRNGRDQANSFEAPSPPAYSSSEIKRNELFDSHPFKNMVNEASSVSVEKESIPNTAPYDTVSSKTITTSISSDFGLKRNETFHTALRPKDKHNRISKMRSKSFNKKQEFVQTLGKQVPSDDFFGSTIVEKSATSKPFSTQANGIPIPSKTLPPNLGVQQPQEHVKVSYGTEETKSHNHVGDPMLHSEKRSIQDRPSSSYGRPRPKSFKETPDKAISRRPTTAADFITFKRTGLRRSKDKKPNLYPPDDTLSDASQISDDMHEIVPIDNSATNRTSNKINKAEVKMQKPSSPQTKLLQIATRPNSKETIDMYVKFQDAVKPNERNLVSPIKTDLLQFHPIKNDLMKRNNRHSVQRMNEHHRSSIPDVENVNRINFERGNSHGPRITNDNDKQSLSITDQMKEKLTSTFTPKRSSKPTNIATGRGMNTYERGGNGRISSNVRLPSEKGSQNLTRSMTIGHGEKYTRSNKQTKPIERSQTPAVGGREKLQYRYDVKSILESAEILKSRNRYSHYMRTKSFNHF